MNQIKVFSPATVSNVACGFDVLGFPIDSIGDEMMSLTINSKSFVVREAFKKKS